MNDKKWEELEKLSHKYSGLKLLMLRNKRIHRKKESDILSNFIALFFIIIMILIVFLSRS